MIFSTYMGPKASEKSSWNYDWKRKANIQNFRNLFQNYQIRLEWDS